VPQRKIKIFIVEGRSSLNGHFITTSQNFTFQLTLNFLNRSSQFFSIFSMLARSAINPNIGDLTMNEDLEILVCKNVDAQINMNHILCMDRFLSKSVRRVQRKERQRHCRAL
jgi:hypothetical protein